MELASQLSVFAQTIVNDRNKAGELLITIFENILKEPNNQKYRDLNFERISNKLIKCKICVDLLFSAGFELTNDHKRMILNDNAQFNQLKLIHDSLLQIISNNKLNAKSNIITQQAITPSINDEKQQYSVHPDPINSNNNIKQPMQQLLDQGISKEEAEKAMKMSMENNDIKYDYKSLSTSEETTAVTEQTIAELVEQGVSVYKAKQAIKMSMESNNNKEEEQKYPSNSSLELLIEMGFDEYSAAMVMHRCNNDINIAIQRLLQINSALQITQCLLQSNSDSTDLSQHKQRIDRCLETNCPAVEKCPYLQALRQSINEYHENEHNIDIVDTCNNFHHLLFHHNEDNDYEYIFNALGGVCVAEKCDIVQRHFRDRSKAFQIKHDDQKEDDALTDFRDNKLYQLNEVFDQIHCHFRHQYDIGSRLNKNERSLLYDCKDDNKEENEDAKSTISGIKLSNMLKNKKIKHSKLIKNHHFSKYSSSLGQIKIGKSSKMQSSPNKNIIPAYSYSYPFCYKDIAKNKDRMDCIYVPSKYDSLKQELLINDIYSIHIDNWNCCMGKATKLKQTIIARKQWAKTMIMYRGKEAQIEGTGSYRDPLYFGYKDGTPITRNHLFALWIYCADDKFQRAFTETFRALCDTDDCNSIKERHSNFHHYGKVLKEAVEIFGTLYVKGTVKRMYHGINREMIFNGMCERIYGVLSTTYSRNVGIQFSKGCGMILELVPYQTLKYFRCDWLSPFSHEGELLFYGGWRTMHFANITNAETGADFIDHVLSIRIIDTMANSQYLWIDPSDACDLTDDRMKKTVTELKLPSLSKIKNKCLCLALIHHELNRNGYKTDKYLSYPDLNNYVDQLLHQICQNKLTVDINWKTMNANILNKVDNGYIGYLFLKSLFCSKEYEGINLEILSALYPNMTLVRVFKMTMIESKFLEDIIGFFETFNDTKLQHVQLYLVKEVGAANIYEQVDKYQGKFNNAGFKLEYGKSWMYCYLLDISKLPKYARVVAIQEIHNNMEEFWGNIL